jgi:hypothetical protein
MPAPATDVDFFLAACMRADRPAAERSLRRIDLDQLRDDGYAMMVRAAEAGNTTAVELMLDLGFPGECPRRRRRHATARRGRRPNET